MQTVKHRVKHSVKHIVLDIGQVLAYWEAEIPYRRLIPDEAQRRWFLTEVCSPDWNREQDRGRDWEEAENLLIAQYPDQADLIRAYQQYWPEMLPHALEDSVQVMQRLLQQGTDVTLLTNWNQHTFARARKMYPFLSSTRGVTVSGEVKLIKPDPAIYQLHARTFELEPAGILFFDDSAKNVQAAREQGWMAELFTSAEQMEADLRRYGVL